MNLGYTFTDCAILIISCVIALTSLTACVTLLVHRRSRRPMDRRIERNLALAAEADRYRGRLNPRRLGLQRM